MLKSCTLVLLFLLTACIQQQPNEYTKNVGINTKGVLNPISFSINGKEITGTIDLDEYDTTEDRSMVVLVKVQNNTDYPLTELDVLFIDQQSNVWGFERGEDSPEGEFPGASGTCGRTVLAHKSCTVALAFTTTLSGYYSQQVQFTYKNLIEDNDRFSNLTLLAGVPASLIYFEDAKTQFHFGQQVGSAGRYFVERTEKVTFHEKLIVMNKGELRARNVITSLSHSCSSEETGFCPSGMDDEGEAWWYETNCPTVLYANEECEVDVYFVPQNQDPLIGDTPVDIESIEYSSIMRLDYKNDPSLTPAVLNGYFSQISQKIEARFSTTIDAQVIDGEIIVGNRNSTIFKINNNGSREGELKAIVVYKAEDDSHLATCIASESAPTDYLRCYKPDLSAELTLEEFPFFFKDRDNCLNSPSESTHLVDVDYGCVFDVFFQPSIAYKTEKDFLLRLDINYDSRWKGLETIVQKKLHTVESHSLAAAYLEVSKVVYNGVTLTPNQPLVDSTPNANYHLGRLALLSPNYVERKGIKIEFYNSGGVPVSILGFKDGSGRTIPFSEANPTGSSIGVQAPYFFEQTLVLSSDCANIAPGAKCSIQTSFAPISMDTTDDELNNMFDSYGYDELTGSVINSIKNFIVTYEDSATYSDLNLYSTTKDIPKRSSQANINAVLVKKGYLADYTKINPGLGQVVAGNTKQTTIKFRNIGSGDITYLPFTGSSISESKSKGFNYIASDLGLSSADHDCLDIFDFNKTDGEDSSSILSRKTTDWDVLAKEESCALTYEWRANDSMHENLDPILNIPSRHPFVRHYVYSMEGQVEQWNWSFPAPGVFDFCVDYFDGDTSNPDLSGDLPTTFGAREVCDSEESYIQAMKFQAEVFSPADIFALSPAPITSALLYRPSYILPNIYYESALYKASETVPEMWIYDTSSIDEYDEEITPFSPAFYSWDEVQSEVRSNASGHEQVYHFGTMPSGTTQRFNFVLVNPYKGTGIITNEKLTGDSAFSFSSGYVKADSSTPTTAKPVAYNEVSNSASTYMGQQVNFQVSSATPGTYTATYEYTYTDGVYSDQENEILRTITKKIYLMVRVIDDAPDIVATYQDYDLELYSDQAPDETLNPTINSLTSSYNGDALNDGAVFSTVKIETRSPEASYIKKRITLKNSSTSSGLYNMKFILHSNPTDKTNATYNQASINMDYTNCDAALSRTRAGGQPSFGVSGSATESCYIDIWYQPTDSDSSNIYYLSALYEVSENQWMQKNIRLDFEAKEPAIVVAVGKTLKPISDEKGNTRMSYAFNFGDIELKENYQEIAFNESSGARRRVTLKNENESTRASFLKSYQEYLAENNLRGFSEANKPSVDVYPDPSEYEIVNGDYFVPIYLAKYNNGEPRIKVEANEGCFYGDNESGLLGYQKGFFNDTVADCSLNFYLYIDLNYINKNLNPSKAADMDGNYATINYFNNDRSSVSFITFHFEGKVRPNTSYKQNEDYLNVISAESRLIHFEWSEMIPDENNLGPIVGYRVLMSNSSFSLDDPLSYAGQYYDVETPSFEISTGLVRKQFYFFKVVPIREDSRYTNNTFLGLGAGRYLSQSNISTLTLVVPPTGHIYNYEKKALISKEYIGPFQLFSDAKLTCNTQNKLNLINAGSAIQFTYQLINNDLWDIIAEDPATTTNYSNLFELSHWVDTAGNKPDTFFGGMIEYDSSETSQTFDNNGQTYYYNEGGECSNCSMNMIRGGLGDYQDIIGLLAPDIPLGVSRCYIQLPN